MPPTPTSEKKVERFLADLATINNVAASTPNQSQSFAPSIRTAKCKLPSQTTIGDFLIAISNHPSSHPHTHPNQQSNFQSRLVGYQN